MKMTKESYTEILEEFEANSSKIIEYAENLKESGKYSIFENRLAADCMRAFIGPRKICDKYYNTEGLHDQHIQTASKKALREINVI